MTVETEDKLASARQQARAQFESIKEMVSKLEHARELEDDREIEEAEREIHEDALSVEVRSDWYQAGDGEGAFTRKPAEYRILLCTGGPAVQIVGTLSEHCEPETAEMQCQDWFQPWTRVVFPDMTSDYYETVLLAYARCFYYGE
jgi:hypothetical protein